jgi:hypothetical protein
MLTKPKNLINVNLVVIASLQNEGRTSNAFQFLYLTYEKRKNQNSHSCIYYTLSTTQQEKLIYKKVKDILMLYVLCLMFCITVY